MISSKIKPFYIQAKKFKNVQFVNEPEARCFLENFFSKVTLFLGR